MKAPTLAAPLWQELFLLLVRGPMGIVGPILVLLLLLWLARNGPWYVKAALLVAVAVLVLIMLGS